MNLDNENYNIHDATKLQNYMRCPRYYFFQHILGWRIEEPNVHQEFGEAWHKAMETLLLYGYTKDSVILAYGRLLNHYRTHFDEMSDDLRYPKTPDFALDMLQRYVRKFAGDESMFRTLYTEIGGSVSIGYSRVVYFKIDSILQYISGPYAGRYFSLEHKTTKTMKGTWLDDWSLKMQVFIYTHVLKCMYGTDAIGVYINGAQFQKTNPGFGRYLILKTDSQMELWLSEVNQLIDRIEEDLDEFREEKNNHSRLMLSFPRNTESCTKYNTLCIYHNFCTSWQNPLLYADAEIPPPGFKLDLWDPRRREVSHTMNIT